jgi:plasmid stabilization system protein ParE
VSIEVFCRSLAAGKVRGRAVNDIKEGYLRAGVGSHFVFYRVSDVPGVLDVVRVLHKRIDFGAHLPDDSVEFEEE